MSIYHINCNTLQFTNRHKCTYMIIVSSCLTQLFYSVGHFTVIGVSKPDRWSARIRLL